MIINSLLEVFSIGMFIPLLSLLFESPSNNQITDFFYNFFDFQPSIYFFLYFLSGIFFLKYSFTLFFTKVQTQFILNLKSELSARLFKNYLDKSIKFHSKTSSSTLVRNIDKEVGVYVNNYVTPIMSFILASLTIILILILLILVNFKSTIYLIVIFSSIYLIIIKTFSKKLNQIGTLRQHHDRLSLKYMYEAVRTIIEVKILELEEFYKKNFFYNVNKIAQISTMRAVIGVLPKMIFEATLIGIIFFMIYYYTSKEFPINDLLSQLVIYATAAFRIMPSLNLITTSNQKIKFGYPAAKLISELKLSSDEIKNQRRKTDIEKIYFNESLGLEKISFSYDKQKNVFRNISAIIKKNCSFGIRGKNGSGKSTLVKILCGLLTPTEGNIKIDNKKINLENTDWKRLIGYVPQEINLIEGTIKENICLGIDNEKYNEAILKKIIKDVNLDQFISKLSKGIDTGISELGSDISGGEKQKIGIARALYRNPEILILDEATSSLDEESELSIVSVLNSKFKNKTKIIISHRLAAFKFCDEVIDLDNLKH